MGNEQSAAYEESGVPATEAVCAAMVGITDLGRARGACTDQLRRAAEFLLLTEPAGALLARDPQEAAWRAALLGQVFNAMRATGVRGVPHSGTGSGMLAWMRALRVTPGAQGVVVTRRRDGSTTGLRVRTDASGELVWNRLPFSLPGWCSSLIKLALERRVGRWGPEPPEYTAVCSRAPGSLPSQRPTHHEGLLDGALFDTGAGPERVVVFSDATRAAVINLGALPAADSDIVAALFGRPGAPAAGGSAVARLRDTPAPLARRDEAEVTVQVGTVGFVALRFVLSDATTFTGVGRELPSLLVSLPADTPLTAGLGLRPVQSTARALADALEAVAADRTAAGVYGPLVAQLACKRLARILGDERLEAAGRRIAELPGAVPSRFWVPVWSRVAACTPGLQLFPADTPLCAPGVVRAVLAAHPGLVARACAGAVERGVPVSLGGALGPRVDLPPDWVAASAGTEANDPTADGDGAAPLLFVPNRMTDAGRCAEMPTEWAGAMAILFQRYGVAAAGTGLYLPPHMRRPARCPPLAWEWLIANANLPHTGSNGVFTAASAMALARYFVAPATDKPRALRALAVGMARRQRTSVYMYYGQRTDPFVPMGGPEFATKAMAAALRTDPTADETELADYFVEHALRTGTLIVYVPRAPDTGAPGGALDRFVASALGVRPARGLGVHAAYAVDVMLTHTGATPRAVLREPPSDLASGLGAARPLQAAVPGLAWLATPLPAPAPEPAVVLGRLLAAAARARSHHAWFAADTFARHCRPTAVAALGATDDGLRWFALESERGADLARGLHQLRLVPGACERADAAACAALFADVATPGTVLRGVGAVDPAGRLGTAVVARADGDLRVRQWRPAIGADAAGVWRVAFAVEPADAPVFANAAARLCAANLAAEDPRFAAATGPLHLLGDGTSPAESFAFVRAAVGSTRRPVAVRPLVVQLDHWPEHAALPWLRDGLKRGAGVVLVGSEDQPIAWDELTLHRWLVDALLAFPVLAVEFFPNYRNLSQRDPAAVQTARYTSSDVPSLQRTLFRTVEPERITEARGGRAKAMSLADVAALMLQGRLGSVQGPPIELMRAAFTASRNPSTHFAADPPLEHDREAMLAWVRLCAQGMGARGGMWIELTQDTFEVEQGVEKGGNIVRIAEKLGLQPAGSIAAAAATLRDWRVSHGWAWAENGYLWHELRHVLDVTVHATAPVPDNVLHVQTPLPFAGGHRAFSYDDRVGVAARSALWATVAVSANDAASPQVPMWYRLARDLAAIAHSAAAPARPRTPSPSPPLWQELQFAPGRSPSPAPPPDEAEPQPAKRRRVILSPSPAP